MNDLPNVGDRGEMRESAVYGGAGTAEFGGKTVKVQPVGAYDDLPVGTTVEVKNTISGKAKVVRVRSPR